MDRWINVRTNEWTDGPNCGVRVNVRGVPSPKALDAAGAGAEAEAAEARRETHGVAAAFDAAKAALEVGVCTKIKLPPIIIRAFNYLKPYAFQARGSNNFFLCIRLTRGF